AKTSSTFVGIKVFDAELNTLTYHNMSADTSSPAMAVKKFDVDEKQMLLLSFSSDASLGECKIKLGGAVEFGGDQPAAPDAGAGKPKLVEMTPPGMTSNDAGSPAMTEVPSTAGDQA